MGLFWDLDRSFDLSMLDGVNAKESVLALE